MFLEYFTMRLFLLILIFFGGPSLADSGKVYQASDSSILKYMQRDLDVSSHWYGAYYTDPDGVDYKLGYMSLEYNEAQTEENKRLFVINSTISFNFIQLGNIYEILIEMNDLYSAEPPFNLLTSQSFSKTSDTISSDFSFFQGGTLNYTNFVNGVRTNFLKPEIEIGLRDIYSVDHWLDKPSVKIGDIIYSNELVEGILVKNENSLTDIKNEIVGGVKYKYFELLVPTDSENNLLGDLYAYKDERNWIKFSLDFGDNFFVDFRLEPEERAKDLNNLADLYILNSIFVTEKSKKLINHYGYKATNTKSVWYEIMGEDNGLIETNYPSQFIKEVDDGRRFLIIGYGLDEMRVEEFEYETVEALAYTEAAKFKENNPELAAIASKLLIEAKSHKNSWSLEEEVIRSIRAYVSDYIEDEYIYYEITDPYHILKGRKGDCTEHAVLFNALLKAAGIPARTATGYLLADDSGTFGGHAWSEVAYDGQWIPVDASWDVWVENSVNYIKTKNEKSFASKNFKLNLHKIEYADGSSSVYN